MRFPRKQFLSILPKWNCQHSRSKLWVFFNSIFPSDVIVKIVSQVFYFIDTRPAWIIRAQLACRASIALTECHVNVKNCVSEIYVSHEKVSSQRTPKQLGQKEWISPVKNGWYGEIYFIVFALSNWKLKISENPSRFGFKQKI